MPFITVTEKVPQIVWWKPWTWKLQPVTKIKREWDWDANLTDDELPLFLEDLWGPNANIC